jgi:tripartite-type tricarboxylate transporter receptor subunit TctC
VCLAVGPGTPATVRTVADYVAWVKTDEKNGSYATGGAGTPNHLMVAALGRAAGIEVVPVHYRGGNAAFGDLVGGSVPAIGAQLDFAARNLQTGKLRILATFGAKRSALLPSVPTAAEQGYPQLVSSGSFCAYVHGSTPAPVQERLSAALRKILAEPAVKAAFRQEFLEPVGSTPQEALRQAKADFEVAARLVKAIGYTPE